MSSISTVLLGLLGAQGSVDVATAWKAGSGVAEAARGLSQLATPEPAAITEEAPINERAPEDAS